MIPTMVLENFDTDGSTSVTPTAALSYSDIQDHLKLDGTTDQALVESLVSAVTKRIEQYIDCKIITQHWSIYYDNFPMGEKKDQWWDGVRDGHIGDLFAPINKIELPFGPCQSITYLKTFDQDDNGTVFSSSNYSVDTKSRVGRLALKIGQVWPVTILRSVNGVQIRGVFGFGGTESVPLDIKQALKISVAKLYESRGDEAEDQRANLSPTTIPATAQMLLEPYRRWKLGGSR